MARKGSFWLCYAGPLTEIQKSGTQVIGEDRSRFPGRGTVGKLGKGGYEEGEPTIEQKREYTDLGLDIGEREEQVSVLPQPCPWR